MVSAELLVNRRNTKAFIWANPIAITLTPKVDTKTAAGGIVRSSTASRPAQVFRLIAQNSSVGNSPGPLRTADGEARKSTFQLLGEWDAVMQVNDWWTGLDGRRYEVVELLPSNGYEVRGRVLVDG